MKVQLVSDLHLEFGHTVILENAGADVLVLAGDICSARNIKDYKWFFLDCVDKFKHVVYIMGNHEHYKHLFNDTAKVIREHIAFDLPNLHFLDNESVDIDGVRFVGATLWTDNNRGCPITESRLQLSMNDYRLIKYKDDKDNYFKFDPRLAHRENTMSQMFIDQHIEDGPCVVVTHHAPSFKSIHPMYANDTYMNGGYASDLEHMMNPNIKLWLHGHTHTPFDYEVNGTRVVCNPRGYPGERQKYTDVVLEI